MEKENVQKGRWISNEHIKAYITGVFKQLFMAIKEDPELSLEMRTNNEAKVYYHKKKILTTTIGYNNRPKVTLLDKKYYKNQECPFKESEKLDNISNLRYLTSIRGYLKKAKRLAYFQSMGEEFTFQQNIALGNRSFDNRYLVVDMEWQFSQAEIIERISKTRIDLVVVDTEKNKNGFNDIYLAELKVGTGATEGKSGIIDHVNKTYEIIQKPEACKALINDVESIIANKIALGIITGKPKELDLAKKPKMMLISAFRGTTEKKLLENEAENAKEHAKRIGMEEPKCILYNALIKIEDNQNCI